MFANNGIYWKVELLQHVNMKHKNNFIDMYIVFIWLSNGKSLYFNPTIFHNL